MNKSVLIGVLFLAACAVGPDYERPAIDVPTSFKEAYGEWRQAVPQEVDHGAWWLVYRDPILDGLEKQVELSNQNVKAAEAAYREASAVADETRTSLFPSLSLNSSVGRQVGTMPTPMAPDTLYGAATWTPDVWGRIRRNIESDEANAGAGAADLAAARLSMQAMLATNYFDLRAQDELKRLLDAMAEADKTALQIVQREYDTGTGNVTDVLAAQSRLEDVQAQAINSGVKRAQLEHAIAVLVGKPPAEFSLPPQKFSDYVPEIPAGLPSTLLERRPDIAASERMVASANAQIGAATAAWFPNITLSGSAGFASMALSKLLQASNSFWSVGPALAETVFDAGAREDRIEQKRAAYDKSVAQYRQTVLTAFQQVEDNLSSMRILAEQKKMQDASAAHARTTEQLMMHHYMGGLEPYSAVLMAQTERLRDERMLLAVRQSRLDASIALIQALGGGWTVSQ
ncbi:MAG: efflux transporter outer membrane subunit [Alphaproteobacteria bacterium]|nr:efflux transporter outer membrane subunit [Alphaproteobacteria bacterium]